ncbi:lasso peptide biosynthesis B2 protein [Butyrivibrio sp. NC3005]|uniref:lasso peptide biosynthesis B2 protein n=1 Tax=Butyrivibrio sp. NC3005 TaxID=1280685 RepID=UPI00040A607A|nr:lasso peptide biosynthesis B2 protein [Butyrivibrio sp. NC3005]
MKNIDIISFFRDNGEKVVTIKSYLYSFYYRFIVKHTSMKKLKKRLGKEGEESPYEETPENLQLANLYAFHVNRITEHLPWNAKCFVRALTLRKLLSEKNISSTIYLGIKNSEHGLQAHAWLRCGNTFITGGYGKGYTKVATFSNL